MRNSERPNEKGDSGVKGFWNFRYKGISRSSLHDYDEYQEKGLIFKLEGL